MLQDVYQQDVILQTKLRKRALKLNVLNGIEVGVATLSMEQIQQIIFVQCIQKAGVQGRQGDGGI